MKRFAILFISIFIIGVLSIPVLAAQTAHMSVAASNDTLSNGDTFTVTVSISPVENCFSGGFMFSYNKEVFEYVGGSALVKGFTMAGVTDMAGSLSGYFMSTSGGVDIQGALFQVTFKVKDTAPSGSYTISGSPNITILVGDAKEKISCSADSVTVTIGCVHEWSFWANAGDTQHTRSCSLCNEVETTAHSWDEGTITKKATCKDPGSMLLTCTGCKATKTEGIPALTSHTYTTDCDVDCDVCGATRTITHQYKTTFSRDKSGHWYECSVCKNKKDVAAHTPGAEATDNEPQTCTTCGYIITPALGHRHDYPSTWTMNDDGHWYACPGCEETDSYAVHSFTDACDSDCSVCGYTRATEHTYNENWSSNATNHWLVCTKCGYVQDKSEHIPGPEGSAGHEQSCTVCGYVISPAATETTENLPIDSTEKQRDHQTQIILLSLAVSIGVAAIGIIVVVIVKKK